MITHNSPASEASRKVANLTWRKNPYTPVYGVKEFVCMSVFSEIWPQLSQGWRNRMGWNFFMISLSKSHIPITFFSRHGAGMAEKPTFWPSIACNFGCHSSFCKPVFASKTAFQFQTLNKKLPRLAPFAGGMKFATQISPLLNIFNFFYKLQALSLTLLKACFEHCVGGDWVPDF